MARGPHAADAELFGPPWHAALAAAATDLAWLLDRGYAEASASKLVGDRHRLRARQRTAVRRSTCALRVAEDRRRRCLAIDDVRGRPLVIDGFNAIIVVESALRGGVILRGLDRAHRDLASVHGSYRRVDVTAQALAELVGAIAASEPASVTWALDRPVSNSGRLRDLILAAATPHPWTVELPPDADRFVLDHGGIVASADGNILDRCGPWIDLPGALLSTTLASAWIVDFAPGPGPAAG
jgi:hypothetical protein